VNEEDDRQPEDAKDLLRWAKETQRNINFIVSQQAKFSADLQQSREDFRERWARADERWARTEESIRALLVVAQSHEEEINTLREAQERTDRQMAETDRRMAETDERLNALINFVERRASGENGGTEAREV
jgi:chromosome segregation ATPase